MISRRNIRIKVMQSLYALESYATEDQKNIALEQEKGLKLLVKNINQASELFNVSLLYLSKIMSYAAIDAQNRQAKYLPTQEDLNVSKKITDNYLLLELLENISFRKCVTEGNLEGKIEQENIKKVYQTLCQQETYLNYISTEERTKEEDKKIIKFIWEELMLADENFQDFMNDNFDGWEDDQELIKVLVGNFFSKPQKVNFQKFISFEKMDYAKELLTTTLEKETYLMECINPKLKNWDAERVAMIDLILLRLGLSELLYFPTIPTKVTINEYIEIAKKYSTDQSGQFVNGVLDNLLKELTQENKIRKIDRKS